MDKTLKIIIVIYVVYITSIFTLSFSNSEYKPATYKDKIENLVRCNVSDDIPAGYICDTRLEHASPNSGYLVEKANKYNYVYYHSNMVDGHTLNYTLQKIVNEFSLYKVDSIENFERCEIFNRDEVIYEDNDLVVFDKTCYDEYLIAVDGIPYHARNLLINNQITIDELKRLGYPIIVNYK